MDLVVPMPLQRLPGGVGQLHISVHNTSADKSEGPIYDHILLYVTYMDIYMCMVYAYSCIHPKICIWGVWTCIWGVLTCFLDV